MRRHEHALVHAQVTAEVVLEVRELLLAAEAGAPADWVLSDVPPRTRIAT